MVGVGTRIESVLPARFLTTSQQGGSSFLMCSVCLCSPDSLRSRLEVSGAPLRSQCPVHGVLVLFLQVLPATHKPGVVPRQMRRYTACGVCLCFSRFPFSRLEVSEAPLCSQYLVPGVFVLFVQVLPAIHRPGVVPRQM